MTPGSPSIVLDRDRLALVNGGTLTVGASVENAGAPTWTVEPEGIITVTDDGTVTAVAEGEATLTATVEGLDGTTAEASIPVTVTATPTLSLNRTEWELNPKLPETDTHGAVYLNGTTTGVLDDAVVRWRVEPYEGPHVLYPKDGEQAEPPTGSPYVPEGVPTPFATPTKIRWNYRPDMYGTDDTSLEFPLVQTSVCAITTGGLTIEAETVITILSPYGD